MSLSMHDVACYADAAAVMIGLPIPPEFRAGVLEHLAGVLGLAQLVMAFPVPDEITAAPVFRP